MFKKMLIGAALSVSTLAFAGPVHGARPVTPPPPARTTPAVPAPVARNDAMGDRFDVEQGRRLLRTYDAVAARRDTRALSSLDPQIATFINEELAESRRVRSDARQLTNLQSKLNRLYGRYDVRSVNEKRRLLSDAIEIAQRDLRGGRADNRFARR